MPAGRKYQFKKSEIAIALLQGGLDWEATIVVMSKIKWDIDGFDNAEVIIS